MTMKRVFTLLFCCIFHAALSLVSAQAYVWKNGRPLVENPDSITFVTPDMSAQVTRITKDEHKNYTEIDFVYPTTDYQDKPVWMSAQLLVTDEQMTTKHISKMALYNHYTSFSSQECPTCGEFDMQLPAITLGIAVVSADYEGFGETGDRVQAYCYGEANARASLDALLAARDWLSAQGYTLSDSILNYGYSQGGQTTVAALKLTQSEYRNKVQFSKNIAGGGPYNLRLNYKKIIEWQTLKNAPVLPMTIITINELENFGLDYKDVFYEPLASNVKSWFISKKFNVDELADLIGTTQIDSFMQPAYTDTTTAEVRATLLEADKHRLTTGWVPDANTQIKLYHSMNDDVVVKENTLEMYQLFQQSGVTQAELDTTTLYGRHYEAGIVFTAQLMVDMSGW